MKRKAMTGGAVGLVLLGAYYLGNLFTGGFGLGPGQGGGKGGGETDRSKIVNSTKAPETSPVSKSEPPGVELGKVVTVLIDGDEYKVLKSPRDSSYDVDNYRTVSLDRIVRMAKIVEGDSGIKVRIGMRENSTPKAEQELRDALLNAGLPPTALYEVKDTIP